METGRYGALPDRTYPGRATDELVPTSVYNEVSEKTSWLKGYGPGTRQSATQKAYHEAGEKYLEAYKVKHPGLTEAALKKLKSTPFRAYIDRYMAKHL